MVVIYLKKGDKTWIMDVSNNEELDNILEGLSKRGFNWRLEVK